jgi:hypothetical protein
MARIFIDLTEDEAHWNGDIPIRVAENDDISGSDMALEIGGHQIIASRTQLMTLFEVLDGWMNGGPVREVGGIKKRLHAAFRELIESRRGTLGRIFGPTFTEDTFINELAEYIALQGLRFRVTGDEPAFNPKAKQ